MTHLPHLLVDISGHGFGHLAQLVPVLERLSQKAPFRLTVRTDLPEPLLRRRLTVPFRLERGALDVGMAMVDAVTVDPEASRRRYLAFHADYGKRLEGEKQRLRTLRPDLLLSNIPYLSIEAAAEVGIPSVALCSLNWAEILRGYFDDDPDLLPIIQRIGRAYRSADLFLLPEPSVPMALPNLRPIGPIAKKGRDRGEEIRKRLGLPPETRLALIALGGIPAAFAFERWPRREGLIWLLPPAIESDRADALPFQKLPLPFHDLIASSDLVVTKIGYGTLTEAVVHGKPILSVLRPGWAETEPLSRWCSARGRFVGIEPERLSAGDFEEALERLLAMPPKPPVEPTGVEEAAEVVAEKLLNRP